jgi:hypothetical protein
LGQKFFLQLSRSRQICFESLLSFAQTIKRAPGRGQYEIDKQEKLVHVVIAQGHAHNEVKVTVNYTAELICCLSDEPP